ncbi:MAG: DUF1343 domain-containing protein [Opitutae bacterium]|nr:DUF1343 domain-containing protein [Opitutae bacterium]
MVLLLGLAGCSSSRHKPRPGATAPVGQITLPSSLNPTATAPAVTLAPANSAVPLLPFPVLLGIDVLEQQGFEPVKGKRLGLLTQPAGVNRRGESTIDVLRRAPGVKLVALYGPEHGIYGDEPAEVVIPDRLDKRTGLPVYSVYGKYRKPTKAMLKGIDAMVIDLQDIGVRSYTYVSAMRYTMEACFEQNIEVIILDRPNPLGGLKVDGPPLDKQWTSYVGAFRVPYVHGLTIGELAKMAREAPGVLEVTEAVRLRGKLTVIPMRGWRRSMRWPDTGLRWIATSPYVQDYASVMGYAMTGLGTYLGDFRTGVGDKHAFRGISHRSIPSDVIERELKALTLPGLRFQRVSIPGKNGQPATGIYVEIVDWDEWRPTELSFYLMKLGCKLEKTNPYSRANIGRQQGFLRHMGSTEFMEALKRDGARVDVDRFFRDWVEKAKVYQQQSRKYWLY